MNISQWKMSSSFSRACGAGSFYPHLENTFTVHSKQILNGMLGFLVLTLLGPVLCHSRSQSASFPQSLTGSVLWPSDPDSHYPSALLQLSGMHLAAETDTLTERSQLENGVSRGKSDCCISLDRT